MAGEASVNKGGKNQRPEYLPSPAEIKAECEAIRETWGPLEFARRRGLRFNPREIVSPRLGLVTHRIACEVVE